MNSCRVCLSFVSNISDISEKSHNGRNLLSIFVEFINIFMEGPCYLCPMCEKALRFTYDFRKKAVKSTQFFETEIKIELPDVDDSVNEVKQALVERNEDKCERSSTKIDSQKDRRCRYCLKYFYHKRALKKHESNHVTQNKGLECDFCGKKYQKHDLTKHFKHVHLKDHSRRFYCDKCHKSFSAASTLSTHKRLVHETSSGNIFKCFHCEKTFTEKDYLRIHIRNVHFVVPLVKCHYCDKEFKSKSTLQTHIIGVHINEKNYVCKICNKSFATDVCRINHMSKFSIQILLSNYFNSNFP